MSEYDYFLQFEDEATAINKIGSHIPPVAGPSKPLYNGNWRPDIAIVGTPPGGVAGFFICIAASATDPVLQPLCLFSCDADKANAGAPFVADISSNVALSYPLFPIMSGRDYPLGTSKMIAANPSKIPPAVLRGTNLSGAEFGALPGSLNADYTFPTLAEANYYASKGMNTLRLPFLWERIQPVLLGPLDAVHLAWLTSFAQNNPAVSIILDVHNYGTYNGKQIGEVGGPPNDQFADLWSRLATQFKSFPNVIFGLMNEPHLQPVADWLTSVNAAIDAIRKTGATNLITVPGISFTGAWTWISSGNAATMIGVVDPGNNFAYEVHQYFDSDGSGTSPTTVSKTIGSERLQAITKWARQNKVRLLLGEFGAADNPPMLAALDDCVGFMTLASDVWLGWTYWSGGPWWGGYMYSIEPNGQVDSAQMTALVPYLT